jgi:Holliday junction resolvasome RuvABC ATP-dependent DNA helicase subunit
MTRLSTALRDFFLTYFTELLNQDPKRAVRPVITGPPDDTLTNLFAGLTSNGTTDWTIPVGTNTETIAVLLVDYNASPIPRPANVISAVSQWDYAVTARSSTRLMLLLVAPSALDQMPESLGNTTEVFSTHRTSRRFFNDVLWKYLLAQIASATGNNADAVKEGLAYLAKQSRDLEPSLRNGIIWQTADLLLQGSLPNSNPLNTLAARIGLPALDTNKSVADAMVALERLAEYFGEDGITAGIHRLKNAQSAAGLGPDLDSLAAHLQQHALSSASVERTPALYYRPPTPIPTWWQNLTVSVIDGLLSDVGIKPAGTLRLDCTNAINTGTRLPGEPCIVGSGASLRTTPPPGVATGAITYQRKAGRTPPVNIPALSNDPLTVFDFAPPPHDTPLKYTAQAVGFTPGLTDVIVLDTFGCRGTAHIPNADKNGPPKKTAQGWNQPLDLPRAGVIDLTVYHASTATAVTLQLRRGDDAIGPAQHIATAPGSTQTTAVIEIEDDDRCQITLEAPDGTALGEWTAQFSVDEPDTAARTRFEALVLAHQTKKKLPVVHTTDNLIYRLEQEYLQSPDSWRPIRAAWSKPIETVGIPDWTDAQLGDISAQPDPRPTLNPPTTLIDAREKTRQYFIAKQRPFGEVDYTDPILAQLSHEYLAEYLLWQENNQDAVWFDAIGIHAATWNLQAGQHTATSEPVAMLLSPLHPLRVAWHCIAQAYLADSIKRHCPAAGLLDPAACPDAGAWTIAPTTQEQISRAFLAVPTDNPHWSVLLNRHYLSKDEERTSILRQLSELGIIASGIPSGFTNSQAADSVAEVAKLLPGRATLRLGIVGGTDGSPACAAGVIGWCTTRFDEDNEPRPFTIEVYQAADNQQPTEERLNELSELTDERVRWYHDFSGPGSNALDLVILDQLGVNALGGANGDPRTPRGNGALTNVRLREDRHSGNVLSESRISTRTSYTPGLAGLLERACITFETTALHDENTSQLQFQPNHAAIGTRLQQSIYLAVTSSQIDPAWVIRGARAQNGYVWDYELPGALGVNEGAGYYLVARPRDAMRRSIERAAALVTATPPPVHELLDEISRRGIPILKRLAAGGSQSRGELGLLLTVRLLQDAFRAGTTTIRLPAIQHECLHLILPVDPYEEPFERIRQSLTGTGTTAQRPDLLVFAIHRTPSNSVTIKITPVEVKFRQGTMSNNDLRDALQQAANLGTVLDTLWAQPPENDLWGVCGTTLLARCLDLAFRIYADETIHGKTPAEWSNIEQAVLTAVLEGTAAITLNTAGRVIAFENTTAPAILDMDGDGRKDTAVLSLNDAAILLGNSGTLSSAAIAAVPALDFSLPQCNPSTTVQPATPPEQASTQPASATQDTAPPTPPEPTVAPPTTPPDHTPTAPPEEAQETTTAAAPVAPGTTPATALIAQAVRDQVTSAFDGFVGNESPVRRLRNDLLRALIESPPHLSKNFLFTGQPSTGKTELARRIANALDLPFIKLDGSGLRSRDKLFELIRGELGTRNLIPSQVGTQAGLPVLYYPPLIVFIDEAHLVPRAVQESLLTMLEALDRTVTLPNEVALMNRTTFMFATTRASDIDPAFRSRCTEVQLKEYTAQEVAEILRRRHPHDWSEHIYQRAALLGRQVPRVALELLKELETAITVSDQPDKPVAEHLEDVRQSREVDDNGLTLTDLEYLNILEGEHRPVGEKAITNMLGTVDRERITDEIEPFLRRRGFIRFGPQGREITPAGREYILAKRRQP